MALDKTLNPVNLALGAALLLGAMTHSAVAEDKMSDMMDRIGAAETELMQLCTGKEDPFAGVKDEDRDPFMRLTIAECALTAISGVQQLGVIDSDRDPFMKDETPAQEPSGATGQQVFADVDRDPFMRLDQLEKDLKKMMDK